MFVGSRSVMSDDHVEVQTKRMFSRYSVIRFFTLEFLIKTKSDAKTTQKGVECRHLSKVSCKKSFIL